MPPPRYHLPAEQALGLLQRGQPLRDCYVSGKLELPDEWNQAMSLGNCVVEHLACMLTSFARPVRLHNCHFRQCDFTFSYFLGGLSVAACAFDSYLDFQAGGHNQAGAPVCLVSNRFAGFVNFFDCQYESAVIVTDNYFLGGTNLLGRPHRIPVTFGVAPLLARNCGQLAADDEGPADTPTPLPDA